MAMTKNEIEDAADEAVRVFKACHTKLGATGVFWHSKSKEQVAGDLAAAIIGRRLEVTRKEP